MNTETKMRIDDEDVKFKDVFETVLPTEKEPKKTRSTRKSSAATINHSSSSSSNDNFSQKRIYEVVIWRDESTQDPLNVWLVRASSIMEARALCAEFTDSDGLDMALIDCSAAMYINYANGFGPPRITKKKGPIGKMKIFVRMPTHNSAKYQKLSVVKTLSSVLVIAEDLQAAQQKMQHGADELIDVHDLPDDIVQLL